MTAKKLESIINSAETLWHKAHVESKTDKRLISALGQIEAAISELYKLKPEK